MKIVYIQSSYKPNDLVGHWFAETKKYCRSTGGDAYIAIKFTHRATQPGDIVVGDSVSCGIHARMYDYLGLQDMLSHRATRKFLERLDEIHPDIIHCHVINDCFLNMGMLCDYVNRHHIKVVWTFHDSRVLTGMCACPCYTGCNQWEIECRTCPREDRVVSPRHEWTNWVSWVHRYRKKHIGGIQNLTIVAPSRWMKSMVSRSYLQNKKCVVINNGINHEIFHPVVSDIREQYHIPKGRKILLSVGNPIWKLKGRDYLMKLVQELPEEYYFVMVGCLPRDVEALKSQGNVLALPRIDRDQLVQFYSAADIFVNPTLADNFPTVNLEAQACGAPVVAFDSEGTRETVSPDGGTVVERMNYDALKDAILNFKYEGSREKSIRFAQKYSQDAVIREYIKLYESL